MQRGLPLASDRQTVGAYLEKWLARAESSVRGSTFLRYGQLVRVHVVPRLGRIPLAKLTPADLSATYAAMMNEGSPPRTAGHAHRVLGRALREAEIAGLVARNVARLVKPPRVPHSEMHTLTATQARTLVEASASDRLGRLYHLALASGARQGELLALRWDDADFDAGSIRIQRTLIRSNRGLEVGETKTASSRRTIPVGKTATQSLRVHRTRQIEERLRVGPAWADNGLVFTNEIGGLLDGVTVTKSSFYPLLRRAALPRVRFHDLRHSAATLLLEAGLHPRVVAERLGHASPSLVMDTYGHVTERMQKDATAALDAILH